MGLTLGLCLYFLRHRLAVCVCFLVNAFCVWRLAVSDAGVPAVFRESSGSQPSLYDLMNADGLSSSLSAAAASAESAMDPAEIPLDDDGTAHQSASLVFEFL